MTFLKPNFMIPSFCCGILWVLLTFSLLWSQLAPRQRPLNAVEYVSTEPWVMAFNEYCPQCGHWNWGLSAKQISQFKGFSRGAAKSSSHCWWHILSQLQPLEMLWFSSKLELLHTPMGLCWQLLCLYTQRAHSSMEARRPADGPNQFTLMLLVGGSSKQASKQGLVWPIKAPFIPSQLCIFFPQCMPPSACLLFNGPLSCNPTDENTSDTPLK